MLPCVFIENVCRECVYKVVILCTTSEFMSLSVVCLPLTFQCVVRAFRS